MSKTGPPPAPPPAPPPSPNQSFGKNWRKKQMERDLNEKEEKFKTDKVNDSHWLPDSVKKWSTMKNFNDLMFRISCILKSGIKPCEMLISFDFDGTLGARRTEISSGKDKSSIVAIKDTFQEEQKTVDLLEDLNELGIPFFVNTAADNPCRARETMQKREYKWKDDVVGHRSEMPISSFLLERGMQHDMKNSESIEHYGQKIKQCGHVFSSSYEKHVPIDYIIDFFKLGTKVILHVDDGLINIKTVIDRGFKAQVFGMYFPTAKNTIIGNEPGHKKAFEYLKNLEIGSVNCDSIIHKSRAAAKRHYKSYGIELKKGDLVNYYFKKQLHKEWIF